MKRKFLLGIGGIIFSAALTGVSYAQDSTTTTTTVTKTVQNSDGTYTVIQYPVGKEVTVDLTPATTLTGAKGVAHVTRMGDTTTVNLDLSGLPADASNYYVYAVDPSGAVTLLGPASIASGASKVSFKTPMDKFMLVLSPNQGLSAISTETPVVFRSAVPTGYAVVNYNSGASHQTATGQTVSSPYNVPLLNVPGFKSENTKLKVDLSPGFKGLRANTAIEAVKNGSVHKIKMHFHNIQTEPNKRIVVWVVSPDGKYTKIGQAISAGGRHEAEVIGETALKDFGLFVTLEDADVNQPTSTVYSTFVLGVE